MKLAVIIPCRNEINAIEECIDAIYASEFKESIALSVFVVDGMSDDGTRGKIVALKDTYPQLELIDNEKQLTPFAFNLGIEAGKGSDFFQIVGARQILSKNYLQGAMEILNSDSSIWCVGGNVENVYLNETGKIIAMAMGTTLGMGLGNFRTLDISGFVDTVGTPMYPAFVFEKIGYFDEDLIRNQDDDFNYRVTKAGGKIYFAHNIGLKYYVRGNFPGLLRQFFQYGYWKVFVNRKHKAVTTLRQLVPPLFVLYLLAIIPSYFFGSWVLILGNIPLVIYLLLLAYFSAVSAEKPKQIWPLVQTYVILHLSYGFGYLRGIFEFLILRKSPSDKQKVMSR